MEPKTTSSTKINTAKFLGGSSLSTTIKKISVSSITEDKFSLELGIIKKQVIHINNLIKSTTLLKAKDEEKKRKEKEKKRFSEKEQKLEKKRESSIKIPSLPAIPQLGFFDRIKNFLFNIFLGYISLKLLPYLPKLSGVVVTIIKVQDTIIDISGKILNGLVSFVDKAYEVHDKTRKFLGDLGGESFTKTFDGFIGAMDKVILASIAAAIAFGELRDTGGGVGGGPGGGRPGRPGRGGGGYRNSYGGGRRGLDGDFRRGKFTGYVRGFGVSDTAGQGFNLWKQRGTLEGGFKKSQNDIIKRYFQKYGRDAAIRRFGQEGVESLGGKYARSGVTNLARKGAVSLLGKGGTKAALRIVQPLVRNIPLIGGIMEFVLSWMSGDSPGKAAFRGVGAGLGTWIGGALGSLIPVPGVGTAIGMYLGSEGGSALGGFLYDKIFNNKDPKQQEIQGRAQGGSVTRGGKLSGPIKRTIQKSKPKRILKVQTTEINPGKSVGGKKNIEKVFPEVQTKEKGKNVNPYGYMKDSYKIGSSIPGFGGLDAILTKARLGEKPSNVDYEKAADGLSSWMQRIYGTGIQRTGAFAEGGKVDPNMFSDDIGMKNILAKALQDTVAPKVNEMINDLRKQLGLKPKEVKKEKDVSEPSPDENLGNATEMVGGARLFMDLGFPPLAAAILAGNIQAESEWKGQRTPWVLNDGAGTNKGLISWNRTRITNAEKFLGKPLETASNAEQVKWIKEELRQYGLLDEFMDPNRTEEQLKSDAYKYIGWGIEGDRWKYSSQIYAALQRGERGSYVPSTSVSLGTSNGNLSAAKRLAESMGLQLNSYVRPGDPGYHGKGRAMDFQTVGAPGNTGTPSQLAYAQKMVSQYGTSLKQLIYTPLGFGIANGKQVGLDYWGDKTNSEHYHHVHVAFKRGGKVKGKRGIDQVRAMLTHGEFVLDVDSTSAVEKNFPGFLDALNKANYDGALKVLRSYAEYEQGSTIHAVIDEKLIPVPVPVSSHQQSSFMISGLSETEDYMSSSYRG